MADIYTAAAVRDEFKDRYALASQRMATDGVAVFVRLADQLPASWRSWPSSTTISDSSSGTAPAPQSVSG